MRHTKKEPKFEMKRVGILHEIDYWLDLAGQLLHSYGNSTGENMKWQYIKSTVNRHQTHFIQC